MKNKKYDLLFILCLFLLGLIVYRLSWPGNHHDAEDAYAYASLLSADHSNLALWDKHHNLYLPLTKITYNLLSRLGINLTAFEWLCWISTVFGALTITMVYIFCRKYQNMTKRNAAITALLLMFSYGFWRYSCTAEIYTLSLALSLLCMCLIFSSCKKHQIWVASAIVGGLSVAVHAAGAVVVFVLGPAYLLWHKKKLQAIYYLTVTGLMTTSNYMLPFWFPKQASYLKNIRLLPSESAIADTNFWSSLPNLKELAGALLSFPQSIIAPNFLLGFKSFQRLVVDLFGSKNMSEEVFLGKSIQGTPLSAAGCATFVLLLILFVLLTLALKKKKVRKLSETLTCYTPWLIAWFILSCMMILWKEPDNPELWIFALLPFLLAGVSMLVKALPSMTLFPLMCALISILAAHNLAGGMLVLRNPDYDLNLQIALLTEKVANGNDVVITAGGEITKNYIRYYSGVKTLNLQGAMIRHQVLLNYPVNDSKIYATGDIFKPPCYIKRSTPIVYNRILAFADKHKGEFKPVAGNEITKIYRFIPRQIHGIQASEKQNNKTK